MSVRKFPMVSKWKKSTYDFGFEASCFTWGVHHLMINNFYGMISLKEYSQYSFMYMKSMTAVCILFKMLIRG